jgi:glycosyltransferase involved in cell wall biosynthesis
MRWFEAGASGCVIVGKRPSTPLVDDLLDWENSTIELPSDGEEAVEKIKELLKRPDRLGEISKRNYQQKLRRHDWRWRIKQMLELLKTPVPTKLNAQLQEIEAYGDD